MDERVIGTVMVIGFFVGVGIQIGRAISEARAERDAREREMREDIDLRCRHVGSALTDVDRRLAALECGQHGAVAKTATA